jgi:hypothetical protein
MEGGSNALAAFADSRPHPTASGTEWADDYSSMVTAALLQHVTKTALILSPDCAHRYSPYCTNKGIWRFENISPDDTHRTPTLVGKLFVRNQVTFQIQTFMQCVWAHFRLSLFDAVYWKWARSIDIR